MQTNDEKKIANCPFCRATAQLYIRNNQYTVRCNNHNCIAYDIEPHFISSDAAINAWNASEVGRGVSMKQFIFSGGKEQMSKVEKVKEVIKEHIDYARCGIFDCRNYIGDSMTTIYENDDVQVDICYYWAYFEVFGLNDDEFKEVEKYYDTLLEGEQ